MLTLLPEQIKSLQETADISLDFHIVWIPRQTLLSQKLLESAGVLGEVTASELPLFFQPLDDGLLSLELDDAFADLYLNRDPSPLHHTALALQALQEAHGEFPRVLGVGENAQRLAQLLGRMRNEHAANPSSSLPKTSTMPSATFENLIIIDREVDFATPLLTQLTYEGLLDEMFKIEHGMTEVDASILAASQGQQQSGASSTTPSHKRKIPLSSSDALFASLRHTHFTIVGSLLNRVARRLQSTYESRHNLTNQTTAEMKAFVSKLPGYQAESSSVKQHTSLLEALLSNTSSPLFRSALEAQQALISGGFDSQSIRDAVEDLSARGAPLQVVLRLLCLESVVSQGIRPRELENARRLVVGAYGQKHLLTVEALEKMGLLAPRGGAFAGLPGAGQASEATQYTALRRPLHLLLDDVNEEDPADVAYVYGGYAPLSVRLVQAVLQKQVLAALARGPTASAQANSAVPDTEASWRGYESAINYVKGKSMDEVLPRGDKMVKSRQVLSGGQGKALKTSVVMFVGGITFAEVAALRFVSRQEEEAGRRRLLVCTTGILSGERVVGAAIKRAEV